MKTIFLIFLAVLILQFSNSCGSKKIETSKDSAIDKHVANNSLDWQGVYTGILPCKDCKGIQTLLILKNDLSYKLQSKHISNSYKINYKSGKFNWCNNEMSIEIKDSLNPLYFWITENLIIKSKSCKDIPSDDTNDSLVLKKDLSGLLEKRWVLFELNGQTNVSSGKDAYLYFNAFDTAFFGNGSCNQINGNYFMNENTLRFNNIASTKMMCMGNQIESELMEVLSNTDSYFIKNDTLQLFRARMAPLAKFTIK